MDETDSFWTREYEIGRPVGIQEEQCDKLENTEECSKAGEEQKAYKRRCE